MLSRSGCVKICCGPRCGMDPQHRAIYQAVEQEHADAMVVPTMCRGLCGAGVTVVREDGVPVKVRNAAEAQDRFVIKI